MSTGDDELFIFDCVIHVHDMSDANLEPSREDAELVRSMQVGMGEMLRPVHGGTLDYATEMSVEDMWDLVFVQSPTDMAMAQVVPVFDWYPRFWAPVELQHAMAAAHPDRVLFLGGNFARIMGIDIAAKRAEWAAS